METNLSPVIGDTASIEFSLNNATWEVGALIAPTCSASSDDANADDSLEVR